MSHKQSWPDICVLTVAPFPIGKKRRPSLCITSPLSVECFDAPLTSCLGGKSFHTKPEAKRFVGILRVARG